MANLTEQLLQSCNKEELIEICLTLQESVTVLRSSVDLVESNNKELRKLCEARKVLAETVERYARKLEEMLRESGVEIQSPEETKPDQDLN